ncbi:hypothetical protein PFISCL1PPCAC_21927, partial [Pristionchus fissidentatus]
TREEMEERSGRGNDQNRLDRVRRVQIEVDHCLACEHGSRHEEDVRTCDTTCVVIRCSIMKEPTRVIDMVTNWTCIVVRSSDASLNFSVNIPIGTKRIWNN